MEKHSIKAAGHNAKLGFHQEPKNLVNCKWDFEEWGRVFAYVQRGTKQWAAFENIVTKCMFNLEFCQQFHLWQLRWLSIIVSDQKSSQQNGLLLNCPILWKLQHAKTIYFQEVVQKEKFLNIYTYIGNYWWHHKVLQNRNLCPCLCLCYFINLMVASTSRPSSDVFPF